MLLLIANADLHAPAHIGKRDILIAGGRVIAIAERIDPAGLPIPCEVLDAGGLPVVPGLVDCHVHVTGGGGEGGFRTRTPELALSTCVRSGVTSVVGVLGTDGVARSMEALVAKTYALREEGISAWCYTGSYRLPLRTITGEVQKDLMMIEPVIGAGEVAISDHRSSKPGEAELAKVAADARVGGILSGKAGIVNVHLGDAPAALEPLERVVAAGDLPRTQFLPTHCNRNPRVLEASLAWARAGGYVDFTTSTVPQFLAEGETSAARSYARLRAEGIPLSRATMSSDGQGSLPRFDSGGKLVGIAVADSGSLLETLRELLALGVPLEEAILPMTLNPAAVLKLAGKGRIEAGAEADLLVLDRDFRPRDLVAKGRILLRGGEVLVRGTFEAP